MSPFLLVLLVVNVIGSRLFTQTLIINITLANTRSINSILQIKKN